MNLIMSAVEETIMVVEPAEGVPQGQGSVNVSHICLVFRPVFTQRVLKYVKRKMEMLFVRGDGVILVRPWLLLLCAGVNRSSIGFTAVKNIAGYRRTSTLTAAS